MVMMLEEPEQLREKGREYRRRAEREANDERRRAYGLLASEFELLADAIEEEAATSRSARNSDRDGSPGM